MTPMSRTITHLRHEWQSAGPLGRVALIAAPLLLAALLLSLLWTPGRSSATVAPIPRATATATAAPVEPWQVAAGEGQGAQAGDAFRVSEACDVQRLSYRAGLSTLGQSDVWIGFAVVNEDGRAVEMTPSRDVLAHPQDEFTFALSPGSYRIRVQGRGAEWSYTVDCVPVD
jgi:hypothetical protein